MKGTVLWFDVKKGIGFIKSDEDKTDYFIHFSKIIAPPGEFRTLDQGDRVEFEPFMADRGNGEKKPQAKNIIVIGKAKGAK